MRAVRRTGPGFGRRLRTKAFGDGDMAAHDAWIACRAIGTLACALPPLVLAGLAPAVAQFLPRPGQPAPGHVSPSAGPVRRIPAAARAGRLCNRAARKPVLRRWRHSRRPADSVCRAVSADPPGTRRRAPPRSAPPASARRRARRSVGCSRASSSRRRKLVKFLADNKTACGVPRTGHHQRQGQPRQDAADCQERLQRWRRRGGPAPGPTLSDALGGPIIADDTSAKQPGTGTFDTLTGNAPVAMSPSAPDASPMRPATGSTRARRTGSGLTSG